MIFCIFRIYGYNGLLRPYRVGISSSLSPSFWHDVSKLPCNFEMDSIGSIVERTSESTRFFAEASDRVDCIDVYCDVSSRFNGIGTDVLADIRDCYGNKIAIPMCLLSDANTSEEVLGEALGSRDTANLIVPLQFGRCESGFDLTSLSVSATLHTAFSFRGDSPVGSSWKWINECTVNGSLPIAMMESFVPGLSIPSLSIHSNPDSIRNYIRDSALHEKLGKLNPFMKSLSPQLLLSHGHEILGGVYSNVVTWRSCPEFDNTFDEFVRESYPDSQMSKIYNTIGKCRLDRALIPIESTALHGAADGKIVEINCSASGIGAHASIGHQLDHFAATLTRSKTRIGATEDVETIEQLRSFAERYNHFNS